MLSDAEIEEILKRALTDEKRGLKNSGVGLAPDAMAYIVRLADGDARAALNNLEIIASMASIGKASDGGPAAGVISLEQAASALQKKALRYDKSGEEHFNLISALHKSLRGSDPDAALYWLARMLEAGEDPLYLARRMVRFASEDIANADPQALTVALNAMAAFKFIGPPEGHLALAQAAVYLATAPKSNRIYRAYNSAVEEIRRTGALPVPLHIRNAPTRLMKDLGYGRDYKYAHDFQDAYAPQDYLPESLRGRRFYEPSDRGYEKRIRERLAYWHRMRQAAEKKEK
jgi:putative ATPase